MLLYFRLACLCFLRRSHVSAAVPYSQVSSRAAFLEYGDPDNPPNLPSFLHDAFTLTFMGDVRGQFCGDCVGSYRDSGHMKHGQWCRPLIVKLALVAFLTGNVLPPPVATTTTDLNYVIWLGDECMNHLNGSMCSPPYAASTFTSLTWTNKEGYPLSKAAIGGIRYTETLAKFAAVAKVPQLGWFTQARTLSNKVAFPTFFRVQPSAEKFWNALGLFLRRVNNFTRIDLSFCDVADDRAESQIAQEALLREGIVSAYAVFWPPGTPTFLPLTMMPGMEERAQVYVDLIAAMKANNAHAHYFKAYQPCTQFEAMHWIAYNDLVGPGHFWVGPDAWLQVYNANILHNIRYVSPFYLGRMSPMLFVSPYDGFVQLTQVPSRYVSAFDTWRKTLGDKLDEILEPWLLKNLEPDTFESSSLDTHFCWTFFDRFFLFDAVWTYLLAATSLVNKTGSQDFTSDQLFAEAKTLDFEGLSGRIRFDANGDALPNYIFSQVRHSSLTFPSPTCGNNASTGEFDPTLAQTQCLWPPQNYDVTVAEYSVELVMIAPLVFHGGGSKPPPDKNLFCSIGLKYNVLTGECVACAPGEFNDKPGQASCDPCAPGSFSNKEATGVCTACIAGTIAATPGATSCTYCAPGKFSSQPQQSFCQDCSVGRHSPANGSALCDLCPRGTFVSISGQSECTGCAGSHRVTRELGTQSGNLCVCDAEYFEIAGEIDCRRCLEGMTCPLGSSMVDYWAAFHRNHTKSSTPTYPLLLEKYFAFSDSPLDVFECLSTRSCPGGALAGESPCCSGCKGLNCGLCDDGLYHAGDRCEPCADSGWQIRLVLVLAPVAIGIFHHFFSHKVVQRDGVTGAVFGSIAFGTLLFSLQVMGMYYRLLVDWPAALSSTLQGSSLVMFNFQVLRASCTFSDSLAIRFGLQLAAPTFVAVCFVALLPLSFLLSALTRGWFPKYSLPSVLNGIGMFFQATFMSLVIVSISIFECYKSPNGKRTLRQYTFVECGSPEHMQVLPVGVAAIVIYVISFLALCIVCSYIAPRYFHKRFFSSSIRFLVYKYRPSTWWYGVILMFRSSLLGLVVVMEPNDGNNQFYLLITFLLLGLVGHMQTCPYPYKFANTVEVFDLVVLIIALVLGSWFIPRVAGSEKDSIVAVLIAIALGAIVVVAFCLFTVVFYTIILKEHSEKRDIDGMKEDLKIIKAAATTLLAISPDDLQRFYARGNYIDRFYLRSASQNVLVDECGIIGTSIGAKRLSKRSSARSKLDERHSDDLQKIVQKLRPISEQKTESSALVIQPNHQSDQDEVAPNLHHQSEHDEVTANLNHHKILLLI